MNMVCCGLAGIHPHDNYISFSPFLPDNIHYLELKDIKYRQSVLDIIIKGNGKKIKLFSLNWNKDISPYADKLEFTLDNLYSMNYCLLNISCNR